MKSKIFRKYGEFCVNHQLEVIMVTIILTALTLTTEYSTTSSESPIQDCLNCYSQVEHNVINLIVTTIFCLAIIHVYFQFSYLNKTIPKYILGLFGCLAIFSSFILVSTISTFRYVGVSDIRDALLFSLLLTDLSKNARLLQIALSGPENEIKRNIAKGISFVGPLLTLDTLVQTLVISIGMLSGIKYLEMLSYIACLTVIVNYIIFLAVYPACLSLILELNKNPINYKYDRAKRKDYKLNPIVQKIKVIMCASLTLVHVHSHFYSEGFSHNTLSTFIATEEESSVDHYFVNGHIVILLLLLVLAAKYAFYEYKKVVNGELQVPQKINNAQFVRKVTDSSHFSLSTSKTTAFFLDYPDDDEKQYENKQTQTSVSFTKFHDDDCVNKIPRIIRNIDECLKIYKSDLGAGALSDEEVIMLVKHKYIAPYQIEKVVDDPERGVKIRRQLIVGTNNFGTALNNLPYKDYDYSKVMGACCENVIGYMTIPVGIVGPLLLDERVLYVPMATTEGCLVASTNRGSRALSKRGIVSRIVADGMSRGPVVRFSSIIEASNAMEWLELPQNFLLIKNSFDASSRYARLIKIHVRIAGRYLFIRFVAKTGDAMGMNMLSKGTELSLKLIQKYFPNMEILSLSGNFCADKKPAAVNWIEGRGKSVVCEAVVPANTVTSVLKTTVHALVDVNISKNMIGSAIAGSIGGFNAHAANIVTAIFIATGQDPAQNVGSSNCMTIMEPCGDNGEDLYISCTMPSIETGTIGGGTVLSAQSACLEILGVQGANEKLPGENASQLARIICGTVLAGELSLIAALSAGHLVKSHLRHNRSSTAICNNFEEKFPHFSLQK